MKQTIRSIFPVRLCKIWDLNFMVKKGNNNYKKTKLTLWRLLFFRLKNINFYPGKTLIFILIYFNALLILIIFSDKAKFLKVTRIFMETATATTIHYSIFK